MFKMCSVVVFILLASSILAADAKQREAEAACRDKLSEIKRLARYGCSKELKTSIRDCAVAGAALGLCLDVPTPVTCLIAAIEIDKCNDAAAARKECDSKLESLSKEINKARNGECFAAVAKDGKCILICEKVDASFELMGIIDLRDNDPTKAIKYFKKK